MTKQRSKQNDHYTSVTYLKHFCGVDGRLYIYRKDKEKKSHPAYPKDICKIPNGDFCDFFSNPSDKYAIREFLNMIEPKWNLAVEGIKAKEVQKHIYFISYFLSYSRCLSPISRKMMKEQEDFYLQHNVLPKIIKEAEISGEITAEQSRDILKNKTIEVSQDEEYVKAACFISSFNAAKSLMSGDWVILENLTEEYFVTCDCPCILKWGSNPSIAQWYVPITPKLALLIQPNYDRQIHPTIEYRQADCGEVKDLNILTVKWADKMIISAMEDEKIKTLVNEYGMYKQDYEKILIYHNGEQFASFRWIVKQMNG